MFSFKEVSKHQKEREAGLAIQDLGNTIEEAFRAAVFNLGCTLESPGGAFKHLSAQAGPQTNQIRPTVGYDPGIKAPYVVLG